MVVGLGALGAVTRVTLDVEPAYEVRQRVFEGLAWDALFDALRRDHRARLQRQRVHALGRGDRPGVGQEPRRRTRPRRSRAELFGARPATVDRHPILGIDPVNCTPQLGRPGRGRTACRTSGWASRPSAGEEIQSEYHRRRARTPSRDRGGARPWPARSRPLLQVMRDPHDRRRHAVAEPAVRAGHRRRSTSRGSREPDGRGARARRRRGGARAVRRAPALGQAVPRPRRGHRAALRAPAGLRARSPSASTRAARSATRGSSAGCSASRPSGRRPARACRAGTSGPSPADG